VDCGLVLLAGFVIGDTGLFHGDLESGDLFINLVLQVLNIGK